MTRYPHLIGAVAKPNFNTLRDGTPVLGDAEQPDFAILNGDDLGRIRCPHQVRRLSDDVAVVRRVVSRAARCRDSRRSRASAAALVCARPGRRPSRKPRPHLAMPLAMPGRTGEIGADRRQQKVVRASRASVHDAAPGLAWSSRRPAPVSIEGGPRHHPRSGRPGRCRSGSGGRENRRRHDRDRLRPKGPGRSIRDRSSSSPCSARRSAAWPWRARSRELLGINYRSRSRCARDGDRNFLRLHVILLGVAGGLERRGRRIIISGPASRTSTRRTTSRRPPTAPSRGAPPNTRSSTEAPSSRRPCGASSHGRTASSSARTR